MKIEEKIKEIKNKEEVILYEDERAAVYKTDISGWVSRDGLYCGTDENLARHWGATHKKCNECGEIYRKNAYCENCSEQIEKEKFFKMEEKEWDCEDFVWSNTYDMYFNDWDEIDDFCEENGCTRQNLQLIICEPVHPRILEEDYWADDLPEDMTLGECDKELEKLIEKVNQYILEEKPILCFRPGKYRVKL